jgi:hypothetical protein
VAGFSRVHNEDRISRRAAWSTLLWKASVVGPLVPVDRDGAGSVEGVGGPGRADGGTFGSVVGGLSGMADSSRRRRLQQSSSKRLIEPGPILRRRPGRRARDGFAVRSSGSRSEDEGGEVKSADQTAVPWGHHVDGG